MARADELDRQFYEDKALTYRDHDATALVRYDKALTLGELASGERVLDVACKDAALLDLAGHRQMALDYTGLDIAERVLEKNRSRWPSARFVRGDAMQGLPFEDGSFGRVFALEILEHVPNPLQLLGEARRVLTEDGRLLVSVPNPYYYMEVINELRGHPDTEGHLHAFTDANMKALLARAGFEVVGRVGTYLQIPKRLRGAFREHACWLVRNVPAILARSRLYSCRRV